MPTEHSRTANPGTREGVSGPSDRTRLRLCILTILAGAVDTDVTAPSFIKALEQVEAWVTGPEPVRHPVPSE